MAFRRPHRLPTCRHVEVGTDLQNMRESLIALVSELADAYPKTSRQVRDAQRALDAVDRLRSALDDASAAELPGDAWSSTIYYGANREAREPEVERVLKLHQADNPQCCVGRDVDRG